MTANKSLIERVASGQPNKSYTGGLASAYLQFGGLGGTNSRDQLSYTKYGVANAYMRVPALKTAVDLIANSVQSIPLQIVNRDGTVLADSRAYANDSATLDLIDSAYADQHLPLMWLWAADVLLYGEAYIAKLMNDYAVLSGLERLNPLGTYAQESAGQIAYFQYSGADGSEMLPPERVVYTRGFNPIDDIAGYSPALAALAKANVELEFDKFTLAFYANSGHPALIFSPKNKDLSRQDVEYLAQLWREQFRGADKFFKTHISQYPFDVQSMPPVDITQPMKVSERAETSIYRAFGVDPSLVGIRNATLTASGAAVTEALRAFMLLTVKPLALKIQNAFNHAGLTEKLDGEGLHLQFDFSDYERSIEIDTAAQQLYERQFLSGAISLGAYQRAIEADVTAQADVTFAIPQGVQFIVAGQPVGMNAPDIQALPSKSTPQFKRYTYNGVTCQATARRSSSRDDKAWERTVRYNEDERTVHYADPDMPMRRNNPEARRDFLARHKCSTKNDPFAAGFWSCYDWANTSEGKARVAYHDELRKWQRKATQKSASVWFNTDVLPDDVVYYIRANLVEGMDKGAVKAVFDTAKAMLDSTLSEATIAIALERLASLGMDDLLEGDD